MLDDDSLTNVLLEPNKVTKLNTRPQSGESTRGKVSHHNVTRSGVRKSQEPCAVPVSVTTSQHPDTQTQRDTRTHGHTDTQTQRDTRTHGHTDTQTQRHRHTDTQTQRHRHTDTQTETQTQTQTTMHMFGMVHEQRQ